MNIQEVKEEFEQADFGKMLSDYERSGRYKSSGICLKILSRSKKAIMNLVNYKV